MDKPHEGTPSHKFQLIYTVLVHSG
jgi:hypothetical protein